MLKNWHTHDNLYLTTDLVAVQINWPLCKQHLPIGLLNITVLKVLVNIFKLFFVHHSSKWYVFSSNALKIFLQLLC